MEWGRKEHARSEWRIHARLGFIWMPRWLLERIIVTLVSLLFAGALGEKAVAFGSVERWLSWNMQPTPNKTLIPARARAKSNFSGLTATRHLLVRPPERHPTLDSQPSILIPKRFSGLVSFGGHYRV